jgi:hypothetical protein
MEPADGNESAQLSYSRCGKGKRSKMTIVRGGESTKESVTGYGERSGYKMAK